MNWLLLNWHPELWNSLGGLKSWSLLGKVLGIELIKRLAKIRTRLHDVNNWTLKLAWPYNLLRGDLSWVLGWWHWNRRLIFLGGWRFTIRCRMLFCAFDMIASFVILALVFFVLRVLRFILLAKLISIETIRIWSWLLLLMLLFFFLLLWSIIANVGLIARIRSVIQCTPSCSQEFTLCSILAKWQPALHL
jgi:hypothetical protein